MLVAGATRCVFFRGRLKCLKFKFDLHYMYLLQASPFRTCTVNSNQVRGRFTALQHQTCTLTVCWVYPVPCTLRTGRGGRFYPHLIFANNSNTAVLRDAKFGDLRTDKKYILCEILTLRSKGNVNRSGQVKVRCASGDRLQTSTFQMAFVAEASQNPHQTSTSCCGHILVRFFWNF